jgi:hypothetical protein
LISGDEGGGNTGRYSLRLRPDSRAAVVVGLAFFFVASVYLVRALRPALLTDPDPQWALPRLVLWLVLLSSTVAAGGAAAGLFRLWSHSRLAPRRLLPFPASPRATALIALGALTIGVLLRIAFIGRLSIPFTDDEVTLITPALALTGTLRDFANSIRGVPYGAPNPHEMMGVLYLYLLRGSLELFGPTVVGLRAISALGGVVSLCTGAALGRALLPRGGGALTGLIVAGLRWHLILSLRGWHAIVLAVLGDVAALLALRARSSGRLSPALAAGLVAGLGTHFYFSGWIIVAALGLFLVWPAEAPGPPRSRLRGPAAFGFGALLAVSPLFLLREGRTQPLFDRVSFESVVVEMRHARSPMPLFSAAAKALPSPWFVSDPEPINDVPGRSRLGWIVGIPFALALGRSLIFPRQDLSALLLSHGLAALAAAVASGEGRNPHGQRFGYLTTLTAVAAAAGVLQLLTAVPARRRRVCAIASVGLLSISGALAARDALVVWPALEATFDGYGGQDWLNGLAAARWERYGRVDVPEALLRVRLAVDPVRRYRLDPFGSLPRLPEPEREPVGGQEFRLLPSGTIPRPDERVVERVRDGWGREWSAVFGHLSRTPKDR